MLVLRKLTKLERGIDKLLKMNTDEALGKLYCMIMRLIIHRFNVRNATGITG
jgi:hypothetical protein